MTAGSRRNGSSKFGPFGRAADEPATRAYEVPARREAYTARTWNEAYTAPARDEAYAAPVRREAYAAPAWDEAYTAPAWDEPDAAPAWDSGTDQEGCWDPEAGEPWEGRAGDAAPEATPRRKAERYTGRHASPRGKTTRKRRVGKVVPAAAVAATVAAGTAAAYILGSGGQPQAAPLNAAVATTSEATASTHGAGTANDADSALVEVNQGTARATTSPTAKRAASSTPSVTPSSATTTPVSSASTAPSVTQSPATTQPATTQSPAAAAPKSQPVTATTVSCNLGYSKLPQNVTAIVSFLLANGYSHNAAAGIAGNIYQESKGNPESEGMGGGGLIGWTPLPSGFVTGNPATDLQTQLRALLTYNQGWSRYLQALNGAASPSSAAYIYVTDFERAGIPAAATREASAENVATACGL